MDLNIQQPNRIAVSNSDVMPSRSRCHANPLYTGQTTKGQLVRQVEQSLPPCQGWKTRVIAIKQGPRGLAWTTGILTQGRTFTHGEKKRREEGRRGVRFVKPESLPSVLPSGFCIACVSILIATVVSRHLPRNTLLQQFTSTLMTVQSLGAVLVEGWGCGLGVPGSSCR